MRLHYCVIKYIHGSGTSVMNYVLCYWLVNLITDKAMDSNVNTNNFYTTICACNEADIEGLSGTLKRYVAFSKSWPIHSGTVVDLP